MFSSESVYMRLSYGKKWGIKAVNFISGWIALIANQYGYNAVQNLARYIMAVSPISMLFIGRTADVATSPSRARAFADLGFDVSHLDVSPLVEHGGRIAWQLRLRFGLGLGINALNREFVRRACELKPQIVFVDKGQFIWARSLDQVREATGALLIHMNPDDPFGQASHLGWPNGSSGFI
jgi:hypothetical protein